MVSELLKIAPDIDPQVVIGTGATQIRHVFSADQVPAIVLAYMAGIKVTFALTVGLIGATCLLNPFIPWKRLPAQGLQTGAVA
jgi:hypothetical protein